MFPLSLGLSIPLPQCVVRWSPQSTKGKDVEGLWPQAASLKLPSATGSTPPSVTAELDFHLGFVSLQNAAGGTSLVVQWVRLRASSAGGLGSIPDRGTRSCMHAITKSSHATTAKPTCHNKKDPACHNKDPVCCN